MLAFLIQSREDVDLVDPADIVGQSEDQQEAWVTSISNKLNSEEKEDCIEGLHYLDKMLDFEYEDIDEEWDRSYVLYILELVISGMSSEETYDYYRQVLKQFETTKNRMRKHAD